MKIQVEFEISDDAPAFTDTQSLPHALSTALSLGIHDGGSASAESALEWLSDHVQNITLVDDEDSDDGEDNDDE